MRNPKKITLSLIVPVYNEEKRIPKLRDIVRFCETNTYVKEIIVVNDGSKDGTMRFLKSMGGDLLKIVSYETNRGKGYAIKKGIERASGTHVVFIDIDLSTPLSTIPELMRVVHQYDVVIGTRKNKHAHLIKRQPFVRELLGKGFTKFSQVLLKVNVTDFTCGFKCYSKRAADIVFSKQTIRRWSFDAEALFLAKKHGFSISELPVVWENDANTKVRFPQDLIRSLYELLKIVWNDRRGNYGVYFKTHSK